MFEKKITGKTIIGYGRGQTLEVPTINITPDDEVSEENYGVYICYTIMNGKKFPSVANLGPQPTFKQTIPILETHIITKFNEVIPETVTVHLIQKIRDIKKFKSVPELIEQISKDLIVTKEYFKNK